MNILFRRLPVLPTILLIAVLGIRALTVLTGTVQGLVHYRDVGSPDSATLIRLGDIQRAGALYPSFDKPPYYVTLYGPLTYGFLFVPYQLALGTGGDPVTGVRLAVLLAFAACVLVVVLLTRLCGASKREALLSLLCVFSVTPLAVWSTQIRGDALALFCALGSIYVACRSTGEAAGRRPLAAGCVAGLAFLVKQTFVAAPMAITIWLLWRRRYREVALMISAWAITVFAVYAFCVQREPSALEHFAALRRPPFDYPGAFTILGSAIAQPAVLFGFTGLVLFLLSPTRGDSRHSETGLLLALYLAAAWLVASLTIVQAGGGINYFWEPAFVTAVFAGSGMLALQRRIEAAPRLSAALVTGFVIVFVFGPELRTGVRQLRTDYTKARSYRRDKQNWEALMAVVARHDILSTLSDVTIRSRNVELADAWLMTTLDQGGTWSYAPVREKLARSAYAAVVINENQANIAEDWRGVRSWPEPVWKELRAHYRPACVAGGLEFWTPVNGDSSGILPQLHGSGCKPTSLP